MDEERVRNLAMTYFTSPEIEIVVPRRYDSVMYPPVSFSSIYLDHLKARLHIPLFPFLVNIFNHYKVVLTYLVSNAVRIRGDNESSWTDIFLNLTRT